jgi:hypothetical protein
LDITDALLDYATLQPGTLNPAECKAFQLTSINDGRWQFCNT